MTRDDALKAFLEELITIAPDLDLDDVGDDDHIQDDLDLDSMDVLNLVVALHKRFGVDISEQDYPEIETPAKAASYLAAKTG